MVAKMAFNREQYNRNEPRLNPQIDQINKVCLKAFGLEDIELRDIEDYGADYTATDEGKPILVETQRVVVWDGGSFPYGQVNVFKRYANKPHTQRDIQMEMPCYHLWTSKDGKSAIMIMWSDIWRYGVESTTMTLRGEEPIIAVSLEHFEKYHIGNPVIEEWW
jgi:hypothetical protein